MNYQFVECFASSELQVHSPNENSLKIIIDNMKKEIEKKIVQLKKDISMDCNRNSNFDRNLATN